VETFLYHVPKTVVFIGNIFFLNITNVAKKVYPKQIYFQNINTSSFLHRRKGKITNKNNRLFWLNQEL